MQPFYLIFFTFSLVLSCSLSVSKKVTKDKTQSLTKDARVKKKWQKFVLSEMAKNEASESWGLVSQRLWQIMDKHTLWQEAKLYIVEPTKQISETKELDEKLAEFKDKISKLASLAP